METVRAPAAAAATAAECVGERAGNQRHSSYAHAKSRPAAQDRDDRQCETEVRPRETDNERPRGPTVELAHRVVVRPRRPVDVG